MKASSPLSWELIRRHRRPLLAGAALMLVGRAAVLGVPAIAKSVYDDAIAGDRPELLLPLADRDGGTAARRRGGELSARAARRRSAASRGCAPSCSGTCCGCRSSSSRARVPARSCRAS